MENRGSILVIDDEQSVANALKIILESYGYSAVIATKGEKGLEDARRIPFCMVITDLYLPDMTGFEVLDIVRREVSRCPVIIITATNTPEILQEAQRRGADGILFKPFLPSELLRLIEKLLTDSEAPCMSED